MNDVLARLRALAEDRRGVAMDGSRTDVDTIWPSEILAILDTPADVDSMVLQVPDWNPYIFADQQARTAITTLIGVVNTLTALLRVKGVV